MKDASSETKKSKKGKIFLGALATGWGFLMLFCAASVVARDGSFSLEMYPIPLAIAGIYASGLILIFGLIYFGCHLGKVQDNAYILLSILFIFLMSLIGWSSAPKAIF